MKLDLSKKRIQQLINTGDELKEVLNSDQLKLHKSIINKIHKKAYSKGSIITEENLCNCSGSNFISNCIIAGIKISFEFIEK